MIYQPRLKNPICPTIYAYLNGEQIDSCLSQGHLRGLKGNEPSAGCEIDDFISYSDKFTLVRGNILTEKTFLGCSLL